MKAELQRIAIAQACGWKWVQPLATHDDWWLASPDAAKRYAAHAVKDHRELGVYELQVIGGKKALPNYPESLDAMHEAEKVLTPTQRVGYVLELVNALNSPGDITLARSIFATAAQRCEAFLKTLNLWTT